MKVVDKRVESGNPETTADCMPNGTFFEGRVSGTEGVYLRHYDGVVMVSDPEDNEWHLSVTVEEGWNVVEIEIHIVK